MLDEYLLEEDQQDSERDTTVVLRRRGQSRQARQTCPTERETAPIIGLFAGLKKVMTKTNKKKNFFFIFFFSIWYIDIYIDVYIYKLFQFKSIWVLVLLALLRISCAFFTMNSIRLNNTIILNTFSTQSVKQLVNIFKRVVLFKIIFCNFGTNTTVTFGYFDVFYQLCKEE